jgi:hypothetical protein
MKIEMEENGVCDGDCIALMNGDGGGGLCGRTCVSMALYCSDDLGVFTGRSRTTLNLHLCINRPPPTHRWPSLRPEMRRRDARGGYGGKGQREEKAISTGESEKNSLHRLDFELNKEHTQKTYSQCANT